MFPNLNAELARRQMKRSELANEINMRPTTLSYKLNGKSPITLIECIDIRNAIDKSLTIDYLFQMKEEALCQD